MRQDRVTAQPEHDPPPFDPAMIELAREALAVRRRRDRVFPPGFFAEPAWDMLLDLLVAEAEGRRLSVSSACLAAAVPQTTALRWLNYMVESGLLQRIQNGNDSRSTLVSLTPKSRRLLVRSLTPSDPPYG